MSQEMHVFLNKSRVPDRSSWQASISSLGLPLVFNLNLNPLVDTGFSPAKIKDIDSGFEIYSESAKEILQSYPNITKAVGNRDWCITFQWGGNLNECACVMAASAGLVKLCNALAFFPGDDLTYDLNGLLNEANSCLADKRK
ncbi:MAG TPA: hypothetical protein VGN44_03775 [Candidatus Angelobacter sp.]|jgi:hypothetical protein